MTWSQKTFSDQDEAKMWLRRRAVDQIQPSRAQVQLGFLSYQEKKSFLFGKRRPGRTENLSRLKE